MKDRKFFDVKNASITLLIVVLCCIKLCMLLMIVGVMKCREEGDTFENFFEVLVL